MDVEQIRKIIATGENQEVEFKESFHSQQKICHILCGLGNTNGGMILFGVSNDGKIFGIKENLDEFQRKISSASQCLSPTPLISIETYKIDKEKIIIAIIQRAIDGIYYMFDGAIYVRIGSTTKKLDGQNHLDFLRNKQILSFDETFENNAKVDDLSLENIKEYLKSRDQRNFLEDHTIEDFLISKKLASKNGKLKIKNSAVLLFAKNPQDFYPQSEIKFVRFKGKEPVEILVHKLIQKNLFSSIEETMELIRENISKSIKLSGDPKRKEEYEYPMEAVREAVVNAIAHRDYFSKDAIQIYVFDNRIEITNPGSLPQGLPRELFGTISVQRNPITYRFLRDLDYVEGLGTGIPRMKNYMRRVGLRDPDFIFTESFFRIILYNKKGRKEPIKSAEDLSERQKKALDYLKRNKTIKSQTYEEINRVSHGTAVSELNELIEFKFIEKVGAYRGAYYILKRKGD